MSDHRFTDINDEPSDLDAPTQAELDALARILGDAAVWDEPDPAIEDRLVAAIMGEAMERSTGDAAAPPSSSAPAQEPPDAPVVDAFAADPSPPPPPPPAPRTERSDGKVIDARSRFRPVALGVLAAAAVFVVVALGWSVLSRSSPDTVTDGELVALAPTELAPDASAEVEVTARPGGTELVLDVSGLPPAPEGSYYEAWLRKSPEVGVSAGTFHLRGGDATVVLWSGVSPDDYPLITVTIQQESEGEGSSGKVVLRGKVGG